MRSTSVIQACKRSMELPSTCDFSLSFRGQGRELMKRDWSGSVTRTLHFGTPTEEEKRCYTRVLQGQTSSSSLSLLFLPSMPSLKLAFSFERRRTRKVRRCVSNDSRTDEILVWRPGHIAIDSLVFPDTVTGYQLDAFARAPLWKEGLGNSSSVLNHRVLP